MAGHEYIPVNFPSKSWLDSLTSVTGIPHILVVENGHKEDGDEWALFRLTDDGLSWYLEGCEFAAGIMTLKIEGKPAVVEISRHATEDEAKTARAALPEDELRRTLIRSVRPKK